jgi:hypothetical protein
LKLKWANEVSAIVDFSMIICNERDEMGVRDIRMAGEESLGGWMLHCFSKRC